MLQALAKAIPYKRFDSRLSIQYDEDASHVLDKDFWRVKDAFKFYYGDEANPCWVLVPAGYLTDGASVPRFLWWLLPPWSAYSQAAAVHDYLIEYGWLYREGVMLPVSRKQADRVFKEAMRVAGIKTWPRQWMYLAVRIWGIVGSKPTATYRDLKRTLESNWEYADPSAPANLQTAL